MTDQTVPEHDGEWRRVLDRNTSHQGHPANRESAKRAIEKHAEFRNTFVVGTDSLANSVRVRFADGTHATVAFGYVEHNVDDVPGGERLPIGTWNTVLPEHGDFGLKHREAEFPTATCPNCFITVPLGAECGLCGWEAQA
jgi:hypothetical protein